MMKFTKIALAVAVTMALFATPIVAQSSALASVAVTANVIGIAPLTAAGVNDLNFGVVTAGVPKTPGSLASDAGRINISGEPTTPVSVSFTLPIVLTNGASTVPISFNATDGLLWSAYPATHTTFNPNVVFFTTTNGTGALIIGISGTVSAPIGAITGTYTGTVTMTVTY